jgi:hypothetical protein
MNRGGGDREHIPEFHRSWTSITRTRVEYVPAVHHTVDDITIEDTWRETWSGDNFFLHQDNDWGILVFTTDENLICLKRCQEVYMDGTFRTAPSPYRQYVSIHGKYRNGVICLVNVLLTGQLIGQYRQTLQVCGMFMNETWTPVPIITLRVSKNSWDYCPCIMFCGLFFCFQLYNISWYPYEGWSYTTSQLYNNFHSWKLLNRE